MEPERNLRTSVDEIERQYQNGELDRVERDLKSFLEERKDQIHELKESMTSKFPEKSIDLAFATKTYILQIRSINPEYEIQKEMNVIKNEIKRQKEEEQTDLEREEIVQRWCEKYAPSWRDRHVMSVIYVFERNKQEYLPILSG